MRRAGGTLPDLEPGGSLPAEPAQRPLAPLERLCRSRKSGVPSGHSGSAHCCWTVRSSESWPSRCAAHRPELLFRRSSGLAHGSRLGPGATLSRTAIGPASAGAGGAAAPFGAFGVGNGHDAQWRRRHRPAAGPDWCSTGLGRSHPKAGGPGGDSSPLAGATTGGCGAAHLRTVSRCISPIGGLGASGPVDDCGPR